MRLILFLLIAFPTLAQAETHPCFAIDPHGMPSASVAACTDLLLDDGASVEARAEGLLVRGIALRALGEYDRSVEDLEASIALSGDTGTMRMLAWTHREMGSLSEAEALYTRVLEEDEHWQGWLSRCVVRQDLGRYQEAVGDCERALALDPENLDALYFTARAHSMLDRPGKALPLAERASTLAPDDPRHRVEIAWALYQLGQAQEAVSLAETALARFPDHRGLTSFLSEVR